MVILNSNIKIFLRPYAASLTNSPFSGIPLNTTLSSYVLGGIFLFLKDAVLTCFIRIACGKIKEKGDLKSREGPRAS